MPGLPLAFLDCPQDEGKVRLHWRTGELVLTAQGSTGSGVRRSGSVPGLVPESQWDARPAHFPSVAGPSHHLPLAPDSGSSTLAVFSVPTSSLIGQPAARVCLPPPPSIPWQGSRVGAGPPLPACWSSVCNLMLGPRTRVRGTAGVRQGASKSEKTELGEGERARVEGKTKV